MTARESYDQPAQISFPSRQGIDAGLVIENVWRGAWVIPVPPMRRIASEVAAEHGLVVDDLTGQSRQRRITAPRHAAMWRIRRETTNSLPQIGRFFNRDHTTVLFACRAHEKRMGMSA